MRTWTTLGSVCGEGEVGLDVLTIPDPRGRITDRFGVDVWPTTITLDRRGVVTDVEVGVAARRSGSGPVGDQEEPRPAAV